MVKLGDVCEVISGQSPESEFYNDKGNGMPFYQGRTEFGEIFIGEPKIWTTKITRIAIKDDILMSVRAPVGPVNIATQEICIGRGIAAIRPNEKIQRNFLFYFLRSVEDKIKGSGGAVFDSINRNQIMDLPIPLPPLSIQQEIVNKIEGWQKIIDGAKQVVENYKPQIDINPEWEMVKLEDVCENITDGKHGDCEPENNSGYYFISAKDLKDGRIDYSDARQITGIDFLDSHKRTKLEVGDVLLSNSGSIGKLALVNDSGIASKTTFQKSVAILKPKKDKIKDIYLFHYLEAKIDDLKRLSDGSTQKNLLLRDIRDFQIAIPSISTQQQIVDRIEQEQQLINANKELIKIFEQKIKDEISKLWQNEEKGKEPTVYNENEMVTVAADK